MSFALTTEQVTAHTKSVTRRLGWTFLKPWDLLQPVVKAQGLKRGEQVQKIGGPIMVTSVRREPLDELFRHSIGGRNPELIAEGFPEMSPSDFVAMFSRANGCEPDAIVTRIEFKYLTTREAEEHETSVKQEQARARNIRRRTK